MLLLLLVSCSFPAFEVPAPEPQLPGPDSCPVDTTCKHLTPDIFTVGSFNIQTFGKAKRSKDEVMDIIVDVLDDFDVLAIQEVRDASETTVPYLLNLTREYNKSAFDFVISPRLGRSSSKEQYVFFYDTDSVTYLNKSFTYDDAEDFFERPPFVACFSIGSDFCIINVHIKPDDAEAEISYLPLVVDEVRSRFDSDIMIVGDLNADGSYYDESLPDVAGNWIIHDGFDTTVAKSDNTYDRIIVSDSLLPFVAGEGVYRFDKLHSLDYDSAKSVSDHYPVYLLLRQ